MQHYLDIQLIPDPEVALHELMSHLYGRLHVRLAQGGFQCVAVSFPGYEARSRSLGAILRLVGASADLDAVMREDWLRAVRDHVRVGTVQAVPGHARPGALRRVQAKSSPERLRRRQMRRHGLTEEQARARIPGDAGARLSEPFVMLASGSTGQKFPLFLRLTTGLIESVPGAFNAYGLSTEATIPVF